MIVTNIKHDSNGNLLQNIVTDSNADELNLPISDAEILSSINNLKLNPITMARRCLVRNV